MKRRFLAALFFIALLILLWVSFSLNWIGDNFGGVGFDEIMFHLNMPLKGAGQSFVGSYIKKVIVPAVGIVVELIIGIALVKAFIPKGKREKIFRPNRIRAAAGILVIVIWSCAVSFRAQRWFGFFDYIESIVLRSNFIEEEYVSPRRDVCKPIIVKEAREKLLFSQKKRRTGYSPPLAI